MTDGRTFILPLLQIWTCFLLTESSSRCFIKEEKAHCALRNLDQVPLLPSYITYLDLTLNYIGELHEKSFSGLEELRILLIQQQETSLVVRKNAFSRLANLRKLDLAYNTDLQLDPGAFNGLVNLQILNLTQCKLSDSILSGDALSPLVALEQLSLAGNDVHRIRPASFFANMSQLHAVDLSRNWIKSFCEEDLFHFQGKRFTLLKLHDIKMSDMNPHWGAWNKCGNPFKNMSMTLLDLSLNGFGVDKALLFFRAIRGTQIHVLLLSHSSSMGKGVWYDNMKDPDWNTFADLAESGVKALDLSKASIFTLKNSVFSSMPDLEELLLTHNSINQIEKDAFDGLSGLRTLNLSHNLLDKIDSGMFRNLASLETLDLSHNNIRTFQGLSSLVHLSLSENSLQHLPPLARLPRLETLRLNNNKLKSVYGLVSWASNVTTIDLRHNKLSNAESFYAVLAEFPRIEEVYLGGNWFSWCFSSNNYSVSPLNNLRFLDLHMTGLQNLWLEGKCLDMFQRLHRLHTLLLQRNLIRSLPPDIFKGLTSLRTLDLSDNSLTYISDATFPKNLRTLKLARNHLGAVDPRAFGALVAIELRGNRFLCDCGLRELQRWLGENKAKMSGDADELNCEYPEHQRGKSLLRAALCKDEKRLTGAEENQRLFGTDCRH